MISGYCAAESVFSADEVSVADTLLMCVSDTEVRETRAVLV